jgi:DNA modification methylase
MMNQLKQLPLFVTRASFRERDVKSVTFKGNFDYPIHRWFRLTPSFSPELVADILAHWELPLNAKVLEPFCGVGTTPLVCQERGLSSFAVELNPLLYFVAKVKTTTFRNLTGLAVAAKKVMGKVQSHFSVLKALDTETFLIDYHDSIPKIRNVTKWWSPLILKKLVAIRMALADASMPVDVANLLKLAAVGILIEVSNARHNHPSLSFSKVAKNDAPVFERFQEQIEMMIHDLQSFSQERPKTLILRGNSKQLEQILPADSVFDAVITSPPYPNRYSYARETRPHMFFLSLVQDGREVGELETEAIGGTWGKATSVLSSQFDYRSTTVEKSLRGIPERIRQHSHLMQNYVIKYFNDVEQHIESLKPFLRRGAQLAYVIGNSKFYKIVLPSDEILADIFEANGFQTISIERMRRRNSKSGLYEAIVFAETR